MYARACLERSEQGDKIQTWWFMSNTSLALPEPVVAKESCGCLHVLVRGAQNKFNTPFFSWIVSFHPSSTTRSAA